MRDEPTVRDDGTSGPVQEGPAEAGQAASPAAAMEDAEVSATLRALPADRFGEAEARHLLWRAGFGGTPAQVRLLVRWGLERSVKALVEYEQFEGEADGAEAFDANIMRPPTAEERQIANAARRGRDEETLARIRLERQRREGEDRRQLASMQQWWLKRMIETPRPLEEKMTLCWHGHFATSFRTIEDSYHMYLQNRFFRANATGSFADLLHGIVRDPAMIAYLDNNDSRRGRPNENLARELLELFGLGIGNYKEEDIKEGARALTGYTFVDDEFVFRQEQHDNGRKTILGRSGSMDGEDFVNAILSRRECAEFIAGKVYSWFVADVPPAERGGWKTLERPQQAVVRAMARRLGSGRYRLKPVLTTLFMSEHFYEPTFMRQQIKSPAQLVVGAIRSLGTPVRDLGILNDAMDLMGQRLFMPPSVKGWDGGRSWINSSTLFVRQNILAFLISGKKPQGYDATADTQRFDALALLTEEGQGGQGDQTPADRAAVLLVTAALGHAPTRVVEAARTYLRSKQDRVTQETAAGVLLIATASPEYQLC